MGDVTDYAQCFDAEYYLAKRYKDTTSEARIHFILRCYHEAFQTLPSSLKILEFGCGPVIQHSISAAARASEMVFSDIAESNREAVKKWLGKDPAAFNWSPHFDYVVQTLEGKGEKEAREREETLRKVVTGVVHCNAIDGALIEKGFEGPYDVVIEHACLVSACATVENFKKSLERLKRLLKPGGRMIVGCPACDVMERATATLYNIGGKMYNFLCIDKEFLVDTIKATGFTIEHVKSRGKDSTSSIKVKELVFIMATMN